jgi:hypothetical protein
VFGEVLCIKQTAGMEDGLIDLIVVQLLVQLHNKQIRLGKDSNTQLDLQLGWFDFGCNN